MNLKLILGVIITICFISCNKNKTPKIVHTETTIEEIIKKDSTLIDVSDLPIQIDSTNVLIHPIGKYKIETKEGKWSLKSGRYRSNSYSISRSSRYQITGNMSNIKFQQLNSDKLTSLTDKIINIQSIIYLKEIYDQTKKQFLIYEINDRDTNQDQKINSQDIKTLYISNLDGKHFKKITQLNNELMDWKIIKSINRLYFKTIKDSNKDGEFDKTDHINYKYLDLNKKALTVTSYNPI